MMGLTESARHLPPPGTEEALRPLSPRSRRVPPCFRLRHCAMPFRRLGSLQAAFSSHRHALAKQRGLCADSKNRLCGNEVTVTSSVKPTVPAACYASRRKMWLESEGWIVRRVMTCDPEPPLKTRP